MSIRDRVIADSTDRAAWLRTRKGRIGGSDAANFAKESSVPAYIRAKLSDGHFAGNTFTAHGNAREALMLAAFRFPANRLLFTAEANKRHVSTPDGVLELPGRVLIAEAKTVQGQDWGGRPPPKYVRQCQWNMHVLGAERCLLIHEAHLALHPVYMEPESQWIERDDAAIARLVTIADAVLAGIDAADQFRKDLTS